MCVWNLTPGRKHAGRAQVGEGATTVSCITVFRLTTDGAPPVDGRRTSALKLVRPERADEAGRQAVGLDLVALVPELAKGVDNDTKDDVHRDGADDDEEGQVVECAQAHVLEGVLVREQHVRRQRQHVARAAARAQPWPRAARKHAASTARQR